MTRSIKFRAWDKEAKEYYYDAEYTYDFQCSSRGCNAESFGEALEYPERYEVEQYTGLKDKNGKEIYEGDIMAQTLIDDPFTKKYPIYVVRWDGEFLSWALKDVSGDDGNDTDLHFFIEEWKKCEVIGNIHENSELLGGENE